MTASETNVAAGPECESRAVIALSSLIFLVTLPVAIGLFGIACVSLITVLYAPIAFLIAIPLVMWGTLLVFHVGRWLRKFSRKPRLFYTFHVCFCLLIILFAFTTEEGGRWQLRTLAGEELLSAVVMGSSALVSAVGALLAIRQLRHHRPPPLPNVSIGEGITEAE